LRELLVQPRQPVPNAVGPAAVRLLQRKERQLPCAGQVTFAMFAVDRERLHCKPAQLRQSGDATDGARFGQLNDLPPEHRCFSEPALAAMPQGEPV
jgi:hypothetical protein